jgi:hypothetical protein
MRKAIKACVVFVLFLSLTVLFPLPAMSEPIVAKYDQISGEPGPEPRSYTRIFKDEYGTPFFEYKLEYIGKQPIGAFTKPYDWRNRNTDFYNSTRKNLTDKPIRFIRLKMYSKSASPMRHVRELPSGKHVVEYEPVGSYIDFAQKPLPKGNIFSPYEERKEKNSYYSYRSSASKNIHADNVKYYEYTVEYNSKEYMFTYYRVFRVNP